MPLELNALEQRVIGCLLEKQISTPDQYPLSLNALVNACNQRSNRDPVLDLDERTVQGVVDGLTRKQLLLEKSGFGSRVPKYQHLFCNTQFGSLKFSPQETAIVCELLVRGPQTPGELRSRAARLAPFQRRQRSRNGARGAGQPRRRRVRRAAATRAGTSRIEISPPVRWRRSAGDQPPHAAESRRVVVRAPTVDGRRCLAGSRASRRSRRRSSRCSDSCAPAAPPISNRV